VVVVSGEGPSFSSGLDRAVLTTDLPRLAGLDDDAVDAAIAGYQEGFTWPSAVDAVVVAAVQGHAVGAGFQLALACDLRVVADDVAFVMRETSLGLVPDLGGTVPLVRAMGYARALEVCATGRAVGAEEAVRTGLAALAVPPHELAGAVDDLVAALLAAPAAAVAETKALLRGALDRDPVQQRAAERAAQRRRLRDVAAAAGSAEG